MTEASSLSGWKRRGATLSSFLICGTMMILGTLLYPLVLLFFTTIAIGFALFRRPAPAAPGPPAAGGSGGGT